MSETPSACPKCGAPAEAGHDFCPRCGGALRSSGPPPLPPVPPPLPKKAVPVLPIALAAAAAALLLAVGVFFLIPGRSPKGASATVTWNGGSPGKVEFEMSRGAESAAEDATDVIRNFLQDHPLSGTFRCRKGAEFDVDPEDAIVAINEVVIGKADDFDGKGGGRTYYFKGPGTYIARFSLKGYRSAWVKIVVTPEADEAVVSVDTELRER